MVTSDMSVLQQDWHTKGNDGGGGEQVVHETDYLTPARPANHHHRTCQGPVLWLYVLPTAKVTITNRHNTRPWQLPYSGCTYVHASMREGKVIWAERSRGEGVQLHMHIRGMIPMLLTSHDTNTVQLQRGECARGGACNGCLC